MPINSRRQRKLRLRNNAYINTTSSFFLQRIVIHQDSLSIVSFVNHLLTLIDCFLASDDRCKNYRDKSTWEFVDYSPSISHHSIHHPATRRRRKQNHIVYWYYCHAKMRFVPPSCTETECFFLRYSEESEWHYFEFSTV